jgi:hypothetical protein
MKMPSMSISNPLGGKKEGEDGDEEAAEGDKKIAEGGADGGDAEGGG